jgi:hypothetical protein
MVRDSVFDRIKESVGDRVFECDSVCSVEGDRVGDSDSDGDHVAEALGASVLVAVGDVDFDRKNSVGDAVSVWEEV